jgi:hypothetical protein
MEQPMAVFSYSTTIYRGDEPVELVVDYRIGEPDAMRGHRAVRIEDAWRIIPRRLEYITLTDEESDRIRVEIGENHEEEP